MPTSTPTEWTKTPEMGLFDYALETLEDHALFWYIIGFLACWGWFWLAEGQGFFVALAKNHPALKHVIVIPRVLARRIGRCLTQQFREFTNKTLRIGKFGTTGLLPAGDEVFWAHVKSTLCGKGVILS